MFIPLPPSIDLYVRIENSSDVEALSECFAPDATVRDEGHSYKGLAAVREWKADTKKKYNHTIEPLEVTRRKDDPQGQAYRQLSRQPCDARIQLCAEGREDRISGNSLMSHVPTA
jgi:hypothetical protein